MKIRKKLIITSIVFILFSFVLLTSYGYITTTILGNNLSKLNIFKSNPFTIVYSDSTNIISGDVSDSFTPGSTITKTFTITNPKTETLSFSIALDDVTNTFTRTNDITYTISLNGTVLKTDIFPTTKETIIYNQSIEPNETLNYTLTINYLNSEENQIVDSGAEIGAKLTFDYSDGFDNILVYGNSIQSRLPEGYTELEYIESTGTQYIDTGITYDNTKDYTIYQDIQGVGTQESKGSGWNAGGAIFVTPSKKWYDGINEFGTNVSENERVKLTIDIAKGTDTLSTYNWYFVSSKTTTTTTRSHTALGTYSGNTGYPLFTSTVSGGSIGSKYNMSAKLYGASIAIDGTIVRNLIPAKNSSNVIGMYDTQNDVFYTNQGTGTFIAGPVIPNPNNPIDIKSVGDKTNNLFNKDTAEITGCVLLGTTFTSTGNACNIDIKLPAGNYILTNDGNVKIYIRNGKVASGVIAEKSVDEASETFTYDASVDGYLRLTIFNSGSSVSNIQIQSGSNATDYEPYGYKIPIVLSSKNILDTTKFARGGLTGRGVEFDSQSRVRSDYIEVESNERYMITLDSSITSNLSAWRTINYYDENYEFLSFAATQDTFTIPQNAKYIRIVLQPKNGEFTNDDILNIQSSKSQLEKGSVATTYEAYVEPTKNNIYLKEPLRKIGNYSDYIDFKNKKVIRNIFEVNNLLSDAAYVNWAEGVSLESTYSNSWRFSLRLKTNYGVINNIKSNKLLQETQANIRENGSYAVALYGENTGYRRADYRIPFDNDLGITNLDTFKTWLASADIKYFFVNTTPIEETIDIPDLSTIKYYNTITVGSSIKPSNITANKNN